MGARAFRMTWLAGLVGVAGAAGIVAACGGGHLVFNVDVYSFIKGTPDTVVPYFIPPNSTVDTGSPPQKVNTPGAGSALVDSVVLTSRVNFVNDSGTGSLGLQLLIATNAAGPYSPALSVNPVTVSGMGTTTPDSVRGQLLTSVDSLFRNSQLWFRVVAHGSNTSLVRPVGGHMVLKSLILTVWMHRLF